jgi:hypothetical protein
MSTTRLVGLPMANELSTAFLARNTAGTLYFSNINSTIFSRAESVL